MNENKALAAQKSQEVGTLAHTDASRAIAETQAALVIASQFPRNTIKATDRIMTACQRPGLAMSATYIYPKGKKDVTGPSIRLAECIAQNWGNIQFGVREIENTKTGSVVCTYAHDLETNTKCEKTFTVPHWRSTKSGGYALTDPRDKYELVANMGARRLRACILAIIPGDIIESAVKECEKTIRANADCSPEGIQYMLKGFEKLGVTKKMIEGYIGRRIETISPAQVINLKGIYSSLDDGMSGPEDWFEVEAKKSGVKIEAAKDDDFDFNTMKGEPQGITKEQTTNVTSLCKKIGIKASERDKGIKGYYKKSKLSELTIEEAQSLIDRLEKSWEKKQAAPDNTTADALADKRLDIKNSLDAIYGEEYKALGWIEETLELVFPEGQDLETILDMMPEAHLDILAAKIAEFKEEA